VLYPTVRGKGITVNAKDPRRELLVEREKLEEREAGETFKVVERQLKSGLDRVDAAKAGRGETVNSDELDPKDYADKYAMKAAAYALYVRWNAQYLE